MIQCQQMKPESLHSPPLNKNQIKLFFFADFWFLFFNKYEKGRKWCYILFNYHHFFLTSIYGEIHRILHFSRCFPFFHPTVILVIILVVQFSCLPSFCWQQLQIEPKQVLKLLSILARWLHTFLHPLSVTCQLCFLTTALPATSGLRSKGTTCANSA